MKDKKALVMGILGVIWIILLGITLTTERINPRVDALIAFVCIAWFAYWTISMMRNRKEPLTVDEFVELKKQTNVQFKKQTNVTPKKNTKTEK